MIRTPQLHPQPRIIPVKQERNPGGQYRQAIGVSTKDQTDAEWNREAIDSFNAALQAIANEGAEDVVW